MKMLNKLKLLPTSKMDKILQIDKYYKYFGYFSIFIYSINMILSGVVIYNNYINNQSYTTFITYILTMYIKMNNIYTIVNTEENVFFSAYLKTNIQFNDLDTRYKIII
jgi:hypothetical protein